MTPEISERARHYQIVLTYDAESGGWLVDLPSFPQIVTSGDTPEEALANAYEAVELAPEGLLSRNRPIPAPDHRAAA